MTASPSLIVRQILMDSGHVQAENAAGWPSFISFLPDTTNEAVAVYDTSGVQDGRIMATGEKVIHPGIQIRVRGPNYARGWDKAVELARTLDAIYRVLAVIDGSTYSVQSISRTGDINYLGMEEDGDRRRFNFTINATMTTKKES